MTTTAAPTRVTEVLTAEEIRELTRPSDLRGLQAVATTWLLIAAAFALVAWRPAVWTVLVALVVLGGRHLGLAILMHDASHRALFRTRWLNDAVGKWLCAAPTWGNFAKYRVHHLAHHAHTNTARDTDRGLVEGFPISRASLLRKFARDLAGLTGLKRVYALLLMDTGFLTYTASTGAQPVDRRGRTWAQWLAIVAQDLGPVLVTNAALYASLRASGHGELYGLWVLSYLTTFSLFVRVRSMAEHACTDVTTNPFLHTRTVVAGPLARLTVAPHRVNFHLEHHLLMTVPHHNLPRMHRLLRRRGALVHCHVATSYAEVLRRVTTPPPSEPTPAQG
jgi:fatty acid desaturase